MEGTAADGHSLARVADDGAGQVLSWTETFLDGAQIEPIPDSSVTAKKFEERIHSLISADMDYVMSEENALVHMPDEQAFMVVHCSEEGSNSVCSSLHGTVTSSLHLFFNRLPGKE